MKTEPYPSNWAVDRIILTQTKEEKNLYKNVQCKKGRKEEKERQKEMKEKIKEGRKERRGKERWKKRKKTGKKEKETMGFHDKKF